MHLPKTFTTFTITQKHPSIQNISNILKQPKPSNTHQKKSQKIPHKLPKNPVHFSKDSFKLNCISNQSRAVHTLTETTEQNCAFAPLKVKFLHTVFVLGIHRIL